MQSVIQGASCSNSQAPTLHLGTYRRAIMAVLSAECFTPAERLRANHSVYECQDSARLALWLTNVTRVRTEREAAALSAFGQALERGEELVKQAPRYATMQQCDELHRLSQHPALTPAEKTSVLFALPTLTYTGAAAYLGWLRLRVAPILGGTFPLAIHLN